MKNKTRPLLILALTVLGISPALAAPPLKVYILAGQSNMDGHAKTRTIDAMRGDPEYADLYKDMTDKDGVEKGSPRAAEMRAGYMKTKGVTEEEEEKLMAGVSDGTYHYLGSAKIYSRIGKAFAESMFKLENQ